MNHKHEITPKKVLGLARAWGAYIHMLAVAIIARQSRISGILEGLEVKK